MDKRFSHLLQFGRCGAERRCGALMNKLAFLFASFAHLDDAFDADDLPLPFIIKRDARDARVKTSRRNTSAPTVVATGRIGSRVAGRGSRLWVTHRPCLHRAGRESLPAGHRVPKPASVRLSAETAASGLR
jgi:hypothetical protein